MDILTDYPLETKVIRKHALMIAWRQAVRFFIKENRRRRSGFAGPRISLSQGHVSLLTEELERKRLSVSHCNFDGDDDQQVGAYFRDRDQSGFFDLGVGVRGRVRCKYPQSLNGSFSVRCEDRTPEQSFRN